MPTKMFVFSSSKQQLGLFYRGTITFSGERSGSPAGAPPGGVAARWEQGGPPPEEETEASRSEGSERGPSQELESRPNVLSGVSSLILQLNKLSRTSQCSSHTFQNILFLGLSSIHSWCARPTIQGSRITVLYT